MSEFLLENRREEAGTFRKVEPGSNAALEALTAFRRCLIFLDSGRDVQVPAPGTN